MKPPKAHRRLLPDLTPAFETYGLAPIGPLQVAVQQQNPEALLAPVHLLAILLTEDKGRGSATAFVHTAQTAGQCMTSCMIADFSCQLGNNLLKQGVCCVFILT